MAQAASRKATPSTKTDSNIVAASTLEPTPAKAAPPPATELPLEFDEQTTISAILIQKLWRGHQARLRFKEAAKVMQTARTQSYIE